MDLRIVDPSISVHYHNPWPAYQEHYPELHLPIGLTLTVTDC